VPSPATATFCDLVFRPRGAFPFRGAGRGYFDLWPPRSPGHRRRCMCF